MRKLTIERILVALDTSADSHAALEAATRLASILKADVVGVFVEDIDLLHMSSLPYAQEVRLPVAATTKIELSGMERQLRSQAARARLQLLRAAEHLDVSWSFKVVRGYVTDELMAEAAEADLLALGRASRTRLRAARHLGSTARQAILGAPRSLLVMRAGVDLNRPVLLIYDGSEESERALTAASRLAQVSGKLRVLICAEDDSSAQAFEEEIRAQTENLRLVLEFRRLYQPDPSNLAYVLKLSGVDLLVLGSSGQLTAETIQAMIDDLEHPVLVVR